ncbi:hypothetical protein OD350_28865 (plasmid) [Clostridium beijerinckii]|uniref:hypothetical protein n=1 Tax=Clostridium beijerinckii TaxID=1520 RepID=UPI0022277EF8|nr:hypothetical protein [Clostridium beijerinckii]UYZ39087.1 hypothetical protein OD350_28865 [Clostridium beijerinckii]
MKLTVIIVAIFLLFTQSVGAIALTISTVIKVRKCNITNNEKYLITFGYMVFLFSILVSLESISKALIN